MASRVRALWLDLSGSLGFVPGVIVTLFAALGISLVEVDQRLGLDGAELLFQGDDSAARTVLSVIAGSLITVAGLTFSITMVVLQLASSQFSPRVLRTFFGDRLTQVTIGTFVGTFVYALLVLRAVGSFGDAAFVPRLSVTLASLLGIAAVVLLVVFLNHVSQLIQVSHVTANIAKETLARIDVLYPERIGEPAEGEDEDADELLARWRAQPPGQVHASGPGYVRRIAVEDVLKRLGDRVERIAFRVRPGDFVSVEVPVAEVWPAAAADACASVIRGAVSISAERDLDQDVDFGVRQLTDIALKALSPGINDPMTAVTCISYLRSILVRLSERPTPPAVRRVPEHDVVVVAPRRRFDEHLEAILQVTRYVEGDAWVAGELLRALASCARAARRAGRPDRLDAIVGVATTVAEVTRGSLESARDRALVDRLVAEVGAAAAG